MRVKKIAPDVALLLLALLILFVPLRVRAAPVERTYRIQAGGYAFSPGVLHANPGDRITIQLASTDVAHGLSIDGYPVDLHAEPGQPAQITFIAGRAGTFKLRCSIACGNLHPFMTGKLVVGPNLLLYRVSGLAILAVCSGCCAGEEELTREPAHPRQAG